MAKTKEKQPKLKFTHVPEYSAHTIHSIIGDVYQGDITRHGEFHPASHRVFDIDSLNEITAFIKGLEKGKE